MKLRSRKIQTAALGDDEQTLAGGPAVIADLVGGPLDGQQRMLFRLRSNFVVPVPRGPVRRFLRQHRQRVSYELAESWEQDGLRHARYEYTRGRP
jgi:hypothetical protein